MWNALELWGGLCTSSPQGKINRDTYQHTLRHHHKQTHTHRDTPTHTHQHYTPHRAHKKDWERHTCKKCMGVFCANTCCWRPARKNRTFLLAMFKEMHCKFWCFWWIQNKFAPTWAPKVWQFLLGVPDAPKNIWFVGPAHSKTSQTSDMITHTTKPLPPTTPHFGSMLIPQAVKDGLTHPEVMKLASLGNQGVQSSHCSRDLVRSLAPAFSELPPVSYVTVPVQGHQDPLDLPLECQYPHDIFAHYSTRTADFEKIFGSDADIQRFWRGKDLTDPAFVHHPALLKEDFRSKCIPLKLHSDGVVMSKTESLHVVSWSSFFGSGDLLEWQVLFAAVVKSARCTSNGRETLSEIYRCFRWSLALLPALKGCILVKTTTIDPGQEALQEPNLLGSHWTLRAGSWQFFRSSATSTNFATRWGFLTSTA